MQKLLDRIKKRHKWLIKWLNFTWYLEETESFRNKSTALKSDTDELDSALKFHLDLSKYISQSESYIRTLEKEHRAMKLALEWCEATGHNDDCMFCGFKDRKIKEVLLSIAIK